MALPGLVAIASCSLVCALGRSASVSSTSSSAYAEVEATYDESLVLLQTRASMYQRHLADDVDFDTKRSLTDSFAAGLNLNTTGSVNSTGGFLASASANSTALADTSGPSPIGANSMQASDPNGTALLPRSSNATSFPSNASFVSVGNATSSPSNGSFFSLAPGVNSVGNDALAAAEFWIEHLGPGMTAPVTEEGFQRVRALRNSIEMEAFSYRVARDLDVSIATTGKRALRGFVPWFSGEKSNGTFVRLQNEMLRISRIPHAWIRPRGSTAPLNEVGLASVRSLGETTEMARFIQKVALEHLDLDVAKENGLYTLSSFYSGQKAKRGYEQLLTELEEQSKLPNPWLVQRHENLSHAGEDCLEACESRSGFCDWCGRGNACCKKDSTDDPADCVGAMTEFVTEGHECVAVATGQTATMDWRGYAAVVALKNDTQMERFVRRKATKLDMTITSDQGLRGFVPFFSGTRGSRPYGALEQEMLKLRDSGRGWLSPRGRTAELDADGYETVAKLGSGVEMAKFMKRVADDMGFSVTSLKGLEGAVPYYSGERTRKSYAEMVAELKSVGQDPDGWLSPADELR